MTDRDKSSSAGTAEEERLARAIRKARDFDPDTLYQHLGDDYPIDSTDSEGRTFYKSWRKEIPSVRAVLAAQSGGAAQAASTPLKADISSLISEFFCGKQRLRDQCADAILARFAAQPPAAPVATVRLRQENDEFYLAPPPCSSADTDTLSDAIASIPAGLNWLIGMGKTRPDEPPFGVQLLHGLKIVAETEGDNLCDTIKAAVAEVSK